MKDAKAYTIDKKQFYDVTRECAPNVNINTIAAISKHESNFNPLAININGHYKLERQPSSYSEAIATTKWLLKNHYNFDVGFAQINSTNFGKLNLRPENAFDACSNLHAAQGVLLDCYIRTGRYSTSLTSRLIGTLSCYNTGNFTSGLRNGYVEKLISASMKVPDIKLLQGAYNQNQKQERQQFNPVLLRTEELKNMVDSRDAFEHSESDVFQQ